MDYTQERSVIEFEVDRMLSNMRKLSLLSNNINIEVSFSHAGDNAFYRLSTVDRFRVEVLQNIPS